MNQRENAIAWWNSLPNQEQGKYWFIYRDAYFTPSTNPSQLTGREIEIIWNRYSKVVSSPVRNVFDKDSKGVFS
jgi:hypothetical protein